ASVRREPTCWSAAATTQPFAAVYATPTSPGTGLPAASAARCRASVTAAHARAARARKGGGERTERGGGDLPLERAARRGAAHQRELSRIVEECALVVRRRAPGLAQRQRARDRPQ